MRDADANENEKSLLDNLTRAGRRLIGFSRTNLFKRLESSGYSFLLSVERHIVRNLVTLYALENNLPIPIGVQDAALMDTAISDADAEFLPDAETDADTPAEQLPPDACAPWTTIAPAPNAPTKTTAPTKTLLLARPAILHA
jgi:hypothetical protein